MACYPSAKHRTRNWAASGSTSRCAKQANELHLQKLAVIQFMGYVVNQAMECRQPFPHGAWTAATL